MSKKITLLLVGIIVLIVVAIILTFPARQNKTSVENVEEYLLSSDEGSVAILAYGDSSETATLEMGGEVYQLARVESGSGARYANEDETVIYWEHQGEATIEINGSLVHTISMIKPVEILNFSVDPYQQDCIGVGPMRCLVVNGEFFYDAITDFEFEEGTRYELRVARSQHENVPADASTFSYQLLEIVTSEKVSTNTPDSSTSSEGSATPADNYSVELLSANQWEWQETIYNDDTVVTPADSSRFTAQFSEDGTFSSTTDCNNTFGNYTLGKDSSLSFGPLASTLMACLDDNGEEILEGKYGAMLAEVQSYMIADNGNLVLMLKYDSGSMIFTPQASSESNN